MATVSVAIPASTPVSGTMDVLTRALMFVRKTIRNMQVRSEIRDLGELDAYLLKDLGLTQQDITAALDVPLANDPSAHLCRVAAGRGRRSK